MSEIEQVYAMVITPHPDDAEFGVAGTVAHWIKEGKEGRREGKRKREKR